MKITIKSVSAKATKPKNKVKVPGKAKQVGNPTKPSNKVKAKVVPKQKKSGTLSKEHKKWIKNQFKEITANLKILNKISADLEKLVGSEIETLDAFYNTISKFDGLSDHLKDIAYNLRDVYGELDDISVDIEDDLHTED